MSLVPLIALVVVAALALSRTINVVPAGSSFVIERLGRVHRVAGPGLHILVPFVDRIAARVPTGDQTIEISAAPGATSDGAAVSCSGTVVVRVTDAGKASTEVNDYQQAVRDLVSRSWVSAVAAQELIAVLDAARGAEPEIRETVRRWGIEIVELTPRLVPDNAALDQLKQRANQERDVRVAAWLRERGQSPGPGGRPTAQQHTQYDEWIDLEVKASQREIEQARREAGEVSAASAMASGPGGGPTRGALSVAVARGTIAPGALGLVEANGRDWTARNVSSVEIARGFRCAVERQEGETLLVRAL
jgi:regulator of protease activity HflC (stomatin/prohibitin superfamily)